jgi:GH15 family glucan-1,4-alpha-glucosidase
VCSSLLDSADGGRFRIAPAGGENGTQRYLPNTNILETTFRTATGSFRVIDFAPRFLQFGRAFRPTQLIRIVEPIEGTPRVAVVCEPKLGWSKERPAVVQGSHHVRFEGFSSQLRLTTDLPLSYLGGRPFTLTGRHHLILTWGSPVEEPLAPLCEKFWSETARYWQRWVKQCDIPPLFQQEVIRSALTLKLHCFEDTGAIIAAMTTSIPESAGSGRTWRDESLSVLIGTRLAVMRVSPWTLRPFSSVATRWTFESVDGKMRPRMARTLLLTRMASVKSPVTCVSAARKRLPKL